VSGKVGVFREIWRLLLFAAQVGFRNGRREPLSSIDSGKGIDQSTFGNCPAWPGILYLIALVENGSSDVLSSAPDREEERIAAFQEYANGGLALLADFFKDRICDLDGLLAFIDTQISRSDLKTDLGFTI
jgi:dnd system-associated protein 4